MRFINNIITSQIIDLPSETESEILQNISSSNINAYLWKVGIK
jgi:hypothetical protein